MTSDDDLTAELRDLLHGAGVKPSVPEPDPGAAARAERQLRDILQQPNSRRRGRAIGVGVAAAAASIATAVAIVTGNVTPTAPAAAATPPMLDFSAADSRGPAAWQGQPGRTQFLKLAAAADRLPPQGRGPVEHIVLDAWWSTNQQDVDGEVTSELIPQRLEQWRTPDGNVRQVAKLGPALTRNGQLDADIDWDDVPAQADDTFPGATPPWGDTIPTDPQRLRRVLAQDDEPACRQTPGGCLLRDAIDIHYNYVAPPTSLAALWRAMADEPDIIYLGNTTDRLGRDAIGFSAPSPDGVSQLIILADPNTGAWLGDETVLVEPSASYDFTPPAVTAFTALVAAERADQPSPPPR